MKSLKDIIRESLIYEMADNLSTFRLKLQDIMPQVIENWCLVKWCDMNPDELTSKRLRNYCATELKAYMNKIVDRKVKCGRKDKVIISSIIDEMELNDKNEVANLIRNKFTKEGLEKYKLSLCFAHAMHINVMAEECANNIKIICNVLSKTKYDVEDYVSGCIE